MVRTSSKPAVVTSAVAAPLPSIAALVARVVPCPMALRSRPSRPLRSTCSGFLGVEASLKASMESPLRSTKSVKVPPTSTPASNDAMKVTFNKALFVQGITRRETLTPGPRWE